MAKLKKPTTSKATNGQSKTLKPFDLLAQTQTAVQSTGRVSAAKGLKKLSNSNASGPKGIQFGLPSHPGVKSSTSAGAGNEWTNLVKTASGGAASLIEGGFLQSGIGSLISGLTSLFDGGETKHETPLVRFALPDPQQQVLHVRSEDLSISSPFEGIPASVGNVLPPTNGTGGIYAIAQSQGPVYRQSEIVQAVKNALLTSCSLNDVIAEI